MASDSGDRSVSSRVKSDRFGARNAGRPRRTASGGRSTTLWWEIQRDAEEWSQSSATESTASVTGSSTLPASAVAHRSWAPKSNAQDALERYRFSRYGLG